MIGSLLPAVDKWRLSLDNNKNIRAPKRVPTEMHLYSTPLLNTTPPEQSHDGPTHHFTNR